MKFKKIILIITISLLFLKGTSVKAANSTVNIGVSRSTVVVGENITVTVTVSSKENLGAWEFSLNYDTNLLRLTSSTANPHVVDYIVNPNTKNKNYTYTLKTLKSGSAKFSLNGVSVVGYDEKRMNTTTNSRTVSIITRAQLEESYSSNNFLSSLSIEGYELEPSFKKDTLEYNLELENEIEKLNVLAKKEDSKATISGLGEKNVNEGPNKIEIKVTAENGNVRTYTLNVFVKEEEPVIVKVADKSYYVIQKAKEINPPTGYLLEEAIINNVLVPSFRNETTNLTLVYLKDEEGNTNFYIYDKINEKYKLYKELSFNKLVIHLIDDEEITIPKNYIKTSLTLDDLDVVCYKLKSDSNFSIIYGMNVETGEKNLYMYDEDERTIQKYNDEEPLILFEQLNNYFKIIMLLSIISSISLILIITLTINYKKKLKRFN